MASCVPVTTSCKTPWVFSFLLRCSFSAKEGDSAAAVRYADDVARYFREGVDRFTDRRVKVCVYELKEAML